MRSVQITGERRAGREPRETTRVRFRGGLPAMLVLACAGAWIAPAAANTEYVIFVDTGDRDGPVYGDQGQFVEPAGQYGFLGNYANTPAWMISKFNVVGALPPGTSAEDIASAYISLPNVDQVWGGAPFDTDLVLHHFETTDDAQVVSADAHLTTPALHDYGAVIPAHTPVPDCTRATLVNVTVAIKDDLANGRAVSCFRFGSDPAGELGAYNLGYIPTKETADACFGAGNDRNLMKLIISVGTPEICGNQVDDDGDGQTDCDDLECKGNPACPETDCADGIDNDGDGNADCADSDCSTDAACPENCTDGIDNNANGLVDCADPGCADFPGEPCHETLCGDGIDGDDDGTTDCDDPDCADALQCAGQVCIQPTSDQDGPVYFGGPERSRIQGWWGQWGDDSAVEVGIHSLPAGLNSADIGLALLRIPQTDNAWTADESALNLRMLVKHIDATDDTRITNGDWKSTPLADIGVYREPGPYQADNHRYVEYNVTDLLKADLDAGRATFAWRVEPEALLPGSVQSLRYFPTVDNTDSVFDLHGGRLCIYRPGAAEDNCSDGIDNDNNGLTDCADPFCSADAACPEVCNNGIDDDADGQVDCADPECLSSAACPETLCGDGLDNDNDGATDCADDDCFGGIACQSEKGYCADGADNDNDCLSDGADPDCSGVAGILPTSSQDAPVYATFVESATPWGFWGAYNGTPLNMVGIHTLPAGIAPSDVLSARLRLPRQDEPWGGDDAALNFNMLAQHIDAADDMQVTLADKDSTPLALIGVYRAPGPYVPDAARYVEFDVTALVQADIAAGRASFAWRVEAETIPAGAHSYRVLYTVDNTTSPRDNRSKLILEVAGQYESSCNDGVDNDADGAIDCGDADCYGRPECPMEVCGDGADNDGDELTDCNDSDCLFSPCCETPIELCANEVDDDGDGMVDCTDDDCRCAPNCGVPPAEICNNGIDDDCDQDADCDDSDCSAAPACLGCNDPFADQDGDGDVDQEDFGAWQACYTGPSLPLPAGCECADGDGNGHVDLFDFDKFQSCASGPTIPAAASCDD